MRPSQDDERGRKSNETVNRQEAEERGPEAASRRRSAKGCSLATRALYQALLLYQAPVRTKYQRTIRGPVRTSEALYQTEAEYQRPCIRGTATWQAPPSRCKQRGESWQTSTAAMYRYLASRRRERVGANDVKAARFTSPSFPRSLFISLASADEPRRHRDWNLASCQVLDTSK